ncbi:unnamed protein product [Miscanthus lutarioriparius]|uniref:Uncharacterized protein n=1 Tax=Miscanthus lutarioriparius TaxID=422564 RepID=A0A811MYC4_9POAL|nr:unnamed protein product [Miscanthus lutarioriparius]
MKLQPLAGSLLRSVISRRNWRACNLSYKEPRDSKILTTTLPTLSRRFVALLSIDEFIYKMEDKHGSFAAKMKRWINRIWTWRRLTSKLQEIKLKLENVDKRNVRYDMRGIAREDGSSDAPCRSTDQISYFPKEEHLVDIDENKELLI